MNSWLPFAESGAERQAVEAVVGGEDARASGRGAPELDRRLDRLAAGAREQAALDPAAGEPDQLLGEQAGKERRPHREHPRRLELERLDERGADPRVVAADAVHPEAAEQVEVARPVGVVEVRALGARPRAVEADRPQDPHELRVDRARPEVEILAAPRVEQRLEAEVAHRAGLARARRCRSARAAAPRTSPPSARSRGSAV